MIQGDLTAASRLMEEHGRQALVNTGKTDSQRPLKAAIEAGQEESVRWLLESGAWLSGVRHPWVEPADEASARRFCVVSYHQDESCRGLEELEVACDNGHLGIVKYLIEEKGAQPYGEEEYFDRTPMLSAAACGHLPVVQYLLQLEEVRG